MFCFRQVHFLSMKKEDEMKDDWILMNYNKE